MAIELQRKQAETRIRLLRRQLQEIERSYGSALATRQAEFQTRFAARRAANPSEPIRTSIRTVEDGMATYDVAIQTQLNNAKNRADGILTFISTQG